MYPKITWPSGRLLCSSRLRLYLSILLSPFCVHSFNWIKRAFFNLARYQAFYILFYLLSEVTGRGNKIVADHLNSYRFGGRGRAFPSLLLYPIAGAIQVRRS